MTSTFSAGPQALGYLYQVRFGLLTVLRAREDQAVAIERLDDIDLSSVEGPPTLMQLKHHVTRSASLSDTSLDLWKTLRVWSESLTDGQWDPDAVHLHLITTGAASTDSAAWYLRPGPSRDPAAALKRLVAAAMASTSKDSALRKSFDAFLSLKDLDRLRVLGAITVFDDAPNIVDTESQIRNEIRAASPPEPALRDRVYEALEGWWFRTVVGHLVGESRDPIPVIQVYRKLWSITKDLQPVSLPISASESEPADPIDPATDTRIFVRQLLALNLASGKYPRDNETRRDAVRAADEAVEILGAGTLWEEVTPGDARKIWRTNARRHAAKGVSGPRWTEMVIITLYGVAEWLRGELLIPHNAAIPKRRWRDEMIGDWEDITGNAVESQSHRYSPEEAARIVGGLDKADPRLALALEIGWELRLGQVRRMMRSDLDLSESAGAGFGMAKVRGRRKKKGTKVYLTAEQRATVDLALSDGYLADLETAYQQGLRNDYPLFPQGRLVRGRAKVTVSDRPTDDRTFHDWFRRLEDAVGVEHVDGRAWYGLRRLATDIAEDVESDERVLNALSGHRNSETRRKIYQQKERHAVLERAVGARARLRETILDSGEVDHE